MPRSSLWTTTRATTVSTSCGSVSRKSPSSRTPTTWALPGPTIRPSCGPPASSPSSSTPTPSSAARASSSASSGCAATNVAAPSGCAWSTATACSCPRASAPSPRPGCRSARFSGCRRCFRARGGSRAITSATSTTDSHTASTSWPVPSCCAARPCCNRWAASTRTFSCTARTSTSPTGWCWQATKTGFCRWKSSTTRARAPRKTRCATCGSFMRPCSSSTASTIRAWAWCSTPS